MILLFSSGGGSAVVATGRASITVISARTAPRGSSPVLLRTPLVSTPVSGDYPTGPVIHVVTSALTGATPTTLPMFLRNPQVPAAPAGDFPTGPVVHVISTGAGTAVGSAPVVLRPQPQFTPVFAPTQNPVLVVKALAQQPPILEPIYIRPAQAPLDYPNTGVHIVTGYAARVSGQPLILRAGLEQGPPPEVVTGVPGAAKGRQYLGGIRRGARAVGRCR